jgi:hypothetical protein
MKKVLSLVLVIAMVLSSMSFAFASTFEDVTGDYEEAIEALVALDVIDGYEDGTFRPEKTITRAELAKVLVEALGYGKLVAGATSNFTDTQGHWANGYVAIAAGTGLVIGYPNGTFLPDKAVTYDEALTMVVRALGYTDASLKGIWPTNYKVKAIDLDLTDDVVMAKADADRGGVAQILFNALEAKIVKIDEDGIVVETAKMLIDNIATLKEYYYVGTDRFDEKDNDYAGNFIDLTPYVYQYLDVYTNDNGDVVYVKDNNSETLTGTVTAVNTTTFEITLEDADGDEYVIDTDGSITVYFNGEATTIDSASEYTDLLYRGSNSAEAKITVISNDDLATIKAGNSEEIESGDLAENFIATKATEAILVDVDYVTGKVKISGENDTIQLPKDSDGEVDLDKITVTGAVESLDEIVEGDVVVAYTSADGSPMDLVVVRDTVEGEVTKTADSETTVYVDGTKYSLSRVTNSVRYDADKPSVGDEGIFYLDNAGKIFAADVDGEDLTDYAVILSSANGNYSTKMDGSIIDYPQLKLLTADGDTVIYDILVDLDLTEADKLDDNATYTEKRTGKTAVTDAALVKVEAADGADSDTDLDISIVPTVGAFDLIKYSVDANGDINEIELVNTTTGKIDDDDVEDVTADDCIVFNTTDKEMATIENLDETVAHTLYYVSGKVKVIVTSGIEASDTSVYGVISSLASVKNSDGDLVTEVTALVDGVEVVYVTKDNNFSYKVSTDTAVKFDFGSDDVLKGTLTMTVANTTDATPNDITNDYIVTADGTFIFASDVAVYLYSVEDDKITVGEISDLDEGRATAIYNTAKTTGIASVIVQVQP